MPGDLLSRYAIWGSVSSQRPVHGPSTAKGPQGRERIFVSEGTVLFRGLPREAELRETGIAVTVSMHDILWREAGRAAEGGA